MRLFFYHFIFHILSLGYADLFVKNGLDIFSANTFTFPRKLLELGLFYVRLVLVYVLSPVALGKLFPLHLVAFIFGALFSWYGVVLLES